MRYPLKAAILSAATLLATPYGWACDFTVIGVTLAFLVKDQIDCGVQPGVAGSLALIDRGVGRLVVAAVVLRLPAALWG